MGAEQHPGTRYLLVRGKSTALRFALPPFGSISIGRSEKNDISVDEPGVADEHLILQVDYGIGVRAIDKDSEVDARGRVSPLPLGKTVDVQMEDRLRMGSVELGFASHEPAKRKHRIWAPAYFEERLIEEAKKNSILSVIRFAVEEVSEDSIESLMYEQLEPQQIVTELGAGDYGVLALGVAEEAAQSLATQIAKSLSAQGGEVAFGTAVTADGDPSSLLDIAERRIKRANTTSASMRVVMESEEMQRVESVVDQVAKTSSHVLILGETGSGKDVVAQMIHDRSDRAGRPFVRVNCVDLGEGSIEDYAGEEGQPLLARAQGGTLLLDEVGGLSQRAQLSLGHLLEKWAAQSRNSRRQAVRVIATSNQDLEVTVEEGQFRKDLFFRLNRVTIQVPPLRERREEIRALARSFVERSEGARVIDDSVFAALENYDWPGNVRELRNVVDRASMMAKQERITLYDLPDPIRGGPMAPLPLSASLDPPRGPMRPAASSAAGPADSGPMTLREEMQELEKRRIIEALDKYPTQTDAAKALDIPLRTFLNRLDALGIPRARKAKKLE